jgi:hypothetical protein
MEQARFTALDDVVVADVLDQIQARRREVAATGGAPSPVRAGHY